MKASVIQLQSQIKKDKNLSDALDIAKDAIEKEQPDLIAFPEMFAFNGGTTEQKKQSAEYIPNGKTSQTLSQFASSNNVCIHGGSIYEHADDKVSNTSVIFNKHGEMIAKYQKIHLFDVTTPNGTSYRESDNVVPGKKIVSYDHEDFKIGCTICYDVRFPELFLELTKLNVDAIVVPASFTYQTGEAHWETLLKCRAIETQSYILAPAQHGEFPNEHGGYNKTWGDSMIIDPWGKVISRVENGSGWATAILDKDHIAEIRSNIPLSSHRVL